MTLGSETIAYGVTKAALIHLVSPVLATALRSTRTIADSVIDELVNRFSAYLETQAVRHSCLSTIVFGHEKSLEALYIPLTVQPSFDDEPDKDTGVLINCFTKAFLPLHKRVLITDTAGMGKSTLSKYLFLQCLKSGFAIPVFIELRHLSSTSTVFHNLITHLNAPSEFSDKPKFTRPQVERVLKRGGFVFFFDGYDEIPFADREFVTRDVKSLIERFPQNLFAITSRPETGLQAFPSFKRFNIRPLAREESFELIRKYDEGGTRSSQLIAKLSGTEYSGVSEFLENPLLTSLLYRSFDYKQSVPLKKHMFYRQVFDALFDWHDSTKDGYNTREKRSGLDMDSFHRTLRVIGFMSVMQGKMEGDTDTVLAWIRKAKEICKVGTFPESSFLEDVVRAVPLFVKDGDYYRWSHKSLAEYFAAQYICTEGKLQQATILSGLIASGQLVRFSNVLDQIYDIDNPAFRAHMILPLARAFTRYYYNSFKGLNPVISGEAIALRKATAFGYWIVVFDDNLKMMLDGFPENVQRAIVEAGGTDIDFAQASVNFTFTEFQSSSAYIIASVAGPMATIMDILAAKKDVLTRRADTIDGLHASSRKQLRLRKAAAPRVVTDDPSSEFNQPQNFMPTTALLATIGQVIAVERMLTFEANFNDETQLVALTNELLRPIVDARGA